VFRKAAVGRRTPTLPLGASFVREFQGEPDIACDGLRPRASALLG
jgi:hypothetical protein